METEASFDLPMPLREAADRTGTQYHRLRKAAGEGRLRAQKIGNQYMVLLSDVQRFLLSGDRRRKLEGDSTDLIATNLEPSSNATYSDDAPSVQTTITASNSSVNLKTNSQSHKREGWKKQVKPNKEGDIPTMARVITITAPKGGTGKTTTTLNLGAAIAELGYKVLLVDCDPQGNLTLCAGVEASQLKNSLDSAIKHYLATYTPQIEPTIVRSPAGLDIVPGNIRLSATADELLVNSQGVFILQKLLRSVKSVYDFILIDTLPSLGVLVKNALVAADEVIIPHESEPLSTEAVAMMLKQVDIMRRSELNPNLKVAGILITKVTKSKLHREVVDFTRDEFGKQVNVFATTIERSIQFAEAQGLRKSILAYKPKDKGAIAYRHLARELLYGTDSLSEDLEIDDEDEMNHNADKPFLAERVGD